MSSLPNFSISGIGSNNTLVNFVIELVIQSEAGRNDTRQLIGSQVRQLFLSGVSVTDLFNAVCLQEIPNPGSGAKLHSTDSGDFYPYCTVETFLDNIPYTVAPSNNHTSIIDEIIGITKLSGFSSRQKQVVNRLPQSYADMFGFGSWALALPAPSPYGLDSTLDKCWEIPSIPTGSNYVASQQLVQKNLLGLGHIQESASNFNARIATLKSNNAATKLESFDYLSNTTFGLMSRVGSFTDDSTLSMNQSSGSNRFGDALSAFNQPSSLWAQRNAVQLQVNNLVGYSTDDASVDEKDYVIFKAKDYAPTTVTPLDTKVYTINTNVSAGNKKTSYWARFRAAKKALGNPNDMPQDSSSTVFSVISGQSSNLVTGSGVFTSNDTSILVKGTDAVAATDSAPVKQQAKAVLTAYARRNVALSDLGQKGVANNVNLQLASAYGYSGILGSQTDVWPGPMSTSDHCHFPSLNPYTVTVNSVPLTIIVTAWMYRNYWQTELNLANLANTSSTLTERQWVAMFRLGNNSDDALKRMSYNSGNNVIAVEQTRKGRNSDGDFVEASDEDKNVIAALKAVLDVPSTNNAAIVTGITNLLTTVYATQYAGFTKQKAVTSINNNSLSAMAIWNKWNSLASAAQNELAAANLALGSANDVANSNPSASAWAQYKAAQLNLGNVDTNSNNTTEDNVTKPAVAPQYSVVEFNLYNWANVNQLANNVNPKNIWNNPNSLLAQLKQANIAVNSALFGTDDGQAKPDRRPYNVTTPANGGRTVTINNEEVGTKFLPTDNDYKISGEKGDIYFENNVKYYNEKIFGATDISDQNGAIGSDKFNNNKRLSAAVAQLEQLISGYNSAASLQGLLNVSTFTALSADVTGFTRLGTPLSLTYEITPATGAITVTGTINSVKFPDIALAVNALIVALKDNSLVSVFTNKSGASPPVFTTNSNYATVKSAITDALAFMNNGGVGAAVNVVPFASVNVQLSTITNIVNNVISIITRSPLVNALIACKRAQVNYNTATTNTNKISGLYTAFNNALSTYNASTSANSAANLVSLNNARDALIAGQQVAEVSQVEAKQSSESALTTIGQLLRSISSNELANVGDVLKLVDSNNAKSDLWNVNVLTVVRRAGTAAINAIDEYDDLYVYIGTLNTALTDVIAKIEAASTGLVPNISTPTVGTATSGAIYDMKAKIDATATDVANILCQLKTLHNNYTNFILSQTDYSGAKKMFNNFDPTKLNERKIRNQYLGNNNLAPSDFAIFWNAALNFDATAGTYDVDSKRSPTTGTGKKDAATDLAKNPTLTLVNKTAVPHFDKLGWVLKESDRTYNNYVNNASVPKLLLLVQQNSLRTQIAANSDVSDMNKIWNAVWDGSSTSVNADYPLASSNTNGIDSTGLNFQGALSALMNCGFTYAQMTSSSSSVVKALAFGVGRISSKPAQGDYAEQLYDDSNSNYVQANALVRVNGLDKITNSSFSNESLANRLSLYGRLTGDKLTLDNCAQFVKSTDSVLDVVNILGKNTDDSVSYTVTISGDTNNVKMNHNAPFDTLQSQYVNTNPPTAGNPNATPSAVGLGVQYLPGQPLISSSDLQNLNKLLAVAQQAQVAAIGQTPVVGYGQFFDNTSSPIVQDYTINGMLNAVRNNSASYNQIINILSKAYYNNAGAQGTTSSLNLDYTKTGNSPAFTLTAPHRRSVLRSAAGVITSNATWNVPANGLFNFALNQADINALTIAIYGDDPLALAKILIGSIVSQTLSIELDANQSSSRNIQQALVLLNGASLRSIVDSVGGGKSLNLRGIYYDAGVAKNATIFRTIAYYLVALVKAGQLSNFVNQVTGLLNGNKPEDYIEVLGEVNTYFATSITSPSSTTPVVYVSNNKITSLPHLLRVMALGGNGSSDFSQLVAKIMNIASNENMIVLSVTNMIIPFTKELFSGGPNALNPSTAVFDQNDNQNGAILFNRLGSSFYSTLDDAALSKAAGPNGVNIDWFSTWATLVAADVPSAAKRLIRAGVKIDTLLSISTEVFMFDYNTGKSVGQSVRVMLFPVAALCQANIIERSQVPNYIINVPL